MYMSALVGMHTSLREAKVDVKAKVQSVVGSVHSIVAIGHSRLVSLAVFKRPLKAVIERPPKSAFVHSAL